MAAMTALQAGKGSSKVEGEKGKTKEERIKTTKDEGQKILSLRGTK